MKKNYLNDEGQLDYKLIIKDELRVIAVCIFILILTLYIYNPRVREAVAMATSVRPETFTELYFEDHLSLPSTITLGKDENFKFTIHNLEYKDMNYPYEVYTICRDPLCVGEKKIIDEGEVSLKHNEYKTINEDYTIEFLTKRIQIVVSLIDKNQQITFWTEGEKE